MLSTSPANRPPSTTRPKFILFISGSFSGVRHRNPVLSRSIYHRIDLKASVIEPKSCRGPVPCEAGKGPFQAGWRQLQPRLFNGKESRTVDRCNRNKREVACDNGYQETCNRRDLQPNRRLDTEPLYRDQRNCEEHHIDQGVESCGSIVL